MTTDTSERGLETLIINQMTGRTSDGEGTVIPEPDLPLYDHPRWQEGSPGNYGREYCVDLHELTLFLESTQPNIAEKVDIHNDGPTRRKFLQRLYQEIGKRGVIEVIRKGLRHGPLDIDLFYGTPSVGNPEAKDRYLLNRFTVSRQLRYSREEIKRALDLGIFINGLPIATFELKNKLTKQTVEDAVEQYKRDRDPREPLFAFGRCVVHFAVDDSEVRMCTELKGPASWFLPFNKGVNNGAGNPVNPDGIKTDYLWKEVLTPQGLTNILENYAQIVTETNAKTGKKKSKQIFPRYHQLDVVRSTLKDVLFDDVGKKYLIQHSAGSGKSNSIAWLAHQLVGVRREGKEIFDSVIVITDRRILDQQIKETIKGFAQVGSTIGHAERSGDLRKFLESGKKIIITTVQKFPFILNEIGTENKDKTFALIIDEAHSSQGGKTTAAMSAALAGSAEKDPEDTINEVIEKRMLSRKMVTNASYFAFTATPKAKTLEMFGIPFSKPDGGVAHRPYHNYSMKQAIQEGFIMDVLKAYTPIESYYTLLNKTSIDPELDARRARKKLRKYVEAHDHAIRLKAEIMVDHFHEQVITFHKLGGMARAMVICDNIERTIQYFLAIRSYLEERKSPYKAIVAFTGEPEFKGEKVSESILNGFPPSEITDKIQEDPYRFLICADKFQTGYDEPLLHTMYVDKHLSGVQAVQTLSRLNRAHPKKRDVFILDFKNNFDSITEAFSAYYQTTILSEETDPNKLHDLKGDLDRVSIYNEEQIDRFVQLYLTDAARETLDPILDDSVAIYLAELDEDGQVDFKSKAKSFCRTYDFLSSILPYSNASWEKLSIFLNFLVTKLPAPMEEDPTRGLMEMIDIESYRTEKKATQAITLAGEDAWIDPIPVSGGAHTIQPEIDRLSNILKAFNERFGGLFEDVDRVFQRISEDIAPRVAEDQAFKNAQENTPGTAQIEMTQALGRVMLTLLKDDTEVYKQFVENEAFRRFVTEMVGELVRA